MKHLKSYNESLRDKMVGVPIDDIHSNLNDMSYDEMLDSITDYCWNNMTEMMYDDQVYEYILSEIDFGFIKPYVYDVINSVANSSSDWIRDIITDELDKTTNFNTHKDVYNLCLRINRIIGDIQYRDNILRGLIKKCDKDKTKEIIIDMIENGS